MDTAVFADCERLLAEFQERILSREALPSVGGSPRSIDATRGSTRTAGATGYWAGLNRGARAISRAAVNRARHSQVSRQGDLFCRVRHEVRHRGVAAYHSGGSAAGRAVGWATRVVHHVRTRALVASRVGFNYVPA